MQEPVYEFAKLEPKPKRRGWLKKTLIAMTSVVILVIALGAGGWFYITGSLKAVGIDVFSTDGSTYDLPTAADINGPINVLLIGSDSRTGLGTTKYGPEGNALADVIILMHVSADRKNAVALSFPRDLMVSVPECPDPETGEMYSAKDMVQINATMNTGGPACTLIAVQALTGVEIPYLAMINFNGVIAMSEAVGGVDVCVSEDISDSYTGLELTAGEHTLIGDEALAFLRTRHGVGDGSDLSRISNQQVFLTSLVRKLKSEGALTNPFTMLRLGTAALENMTLSRSLTNIGVIFGMAREVNDVDLDKITFIKLPVYDLDGAYAGRVAVIEDRAQLIFDKLASDQPLLIETANPGTGAVLAESEAPAEQSSEPTAEETTATDSDPTSVSDEPLPDWVQGTNASTTTCSK
ncbi:MAG: LCP family protein [Aquiluna sp.]|nr:LCP family protein [Aquiluna sp.]MCF8545774.1 LCP family protein [Aquiluna sp.]